MLLFIGLIAFFDPIYESHCTISANFYLYLQYFQQKISNFSKINESQTDPKYFNYNEPNQGLYTIEL